MCQAIFQDVCLVSAPGHDMQGPSLGYALLALVIKHLFVYSWQGICAAP